MSRNDSRIADQVLAGAQVADQRTWRQRLSMIAKAIELRLRFIILMAATGLLFASWDSLANRVEKWGRPKEERHLLTSTSASEESYCPMHPSVVSEQPGQCPICGMTLAARKRAGTAILPPDALSQVRLAPRQIAQAGIRTVAVSFAPATDGMTTVGLVGYDESRRVKVTSEGRGRARIERLDVHSEGEPVRAGQRLAELYSYDVAQSIRLLLEASAARHARPATGHDPDSTPLGDPEERVRLATQALQVLGVRQDQLDAIVADNSPHGHLPVLAPIGGLLIQKLAYQGQYVPEGKLLFEIADLSRVWVVAQVFEEQLALLRVGQSVTATVLAFPGEQFRGRVEQLAPALDPATRSLAVRFGIDNPGNRLRPGMLATVTLNIARTEAPLPRGAICPVTRLPLGSMGPGISVEVQGRTVTVCCEACVPKLKATPNEYLAFASRDTATGFRVITVPESAVIDTGTKKVVYVEASPGIFEGRAVLLGPRSGDSFPVLAGLAPGERVAAAGAFLIDAESQINPATKSQAAVRKDPLALEAAPPARPTPAAIAASAE